jgi:hypothetical protein
MNSDDGSWRLIYVGPSGQLIGSLRPPQNLQLPGVSAGQMGTPASTLASGQSATSAGAAQSTTGGSQPGTPQSGQGNETTAPTGSQAGTSSAGGTDTSGNGSSSSGTNDQESSNSMFPDDSSTSTPTIMGGNIIGVGSKVNHRSVIVYEKAKNYRQFEFIWDPSKDPLTLGGTGTPVGAPAGTLGTTPGTATPGVVNPGTAPLNPAPAPTEPPTTDQNSPPN